MKRMRWIAALFLMVMTVQGVMAAEAIMIAGDACTAPLIEKLAEAFSRKTGKVMKIETASCASGIYKASEGKADIGVSTHEVVLDYLRPGTINTIIAKAPTVIVVNRNNPINNLTLPQLKSILSGEIRNWKDVGGSDLEIKNVLLQPCTTTIFSKKTAKFGKNIKRLEREAVGNPVVATNKLVGGDESAMGLQIYGYESPEVKVLTIDGYLPDEKTFPAQYNFYQDYNVITRGNSSKDVKAFVEFALSQEGQEIVTSLKHIGVKK